MIGKVCALRPFSDRPFLLLFNLISRNVYDAALCQIRYLLVVFHVLEIHSLDVPLIDANLQIIAIFILDRGNWLGFWLLNGFEIFSRRLEFLRRNAR